jgi:hypothetical protein
MSSTKIPRVHKAIFSCTNIELPKAVKPSKFSSGKKPKFNSGITINLFNDDLILGTLLIGQGGIQWRSKECEKLRSLNWTDVANTLDNRLANRKGH